MTEDEIAKEMEAMIQQKPCNWHEVIEHFASQPYPLVYRAFGQLRPKLARIADQRPDYPYTFSKDGTNFVYLNKPAPKE